MLLVFLINTDVIFDYTYLIIHNNITFIIFIFIIFSGICIIREENHPLNANFLNPMFANSERPMFDLLGHFLSVKFSFHWIVANLP